MRRTKTAADIIHARPMKLVASRNTSRETLINSIGGSVVPMKSMTYEPVSLEIRIVQRFPRQLHRQ
jgi:hypothetical protein